MKTKEIDGNLLKLIIKNGSIKLKNQHQQINDLNVFPVPDGDTGSNMQSTMMSGVNAIEDLNDQPIEVVGKALSRGLLMGARGNSGVILSQLFSGFAKAFQQKQTANALAFVDGLRQGVQQAYGAVINPVEGTILTVAREAVERAAAVATEESDIEDVLNVYLNEARESLQRTPELLPILKESGVVDSGGAGLIVIIEGMISALKGEVYKEELTQNHLGVHHDIEGDVEFGYCTEFIIEIDPKKNFNKERFTSQLKKLGDSIVVVADDEICKVHIHTITPGDALNIGQQYGEFMKLKIENMTVQHEELKSQNKANKDETLLKTDVRKKYGIISVVNGKGLKTMFEEMGVNEVIEGGQTMNPSTQDFIDAIDRLNADNILIIPNNKNVMLSAETAAKEVTDKNVVVIPAKTIPQGYASLTMFDANQNLTDIIEEMHELINHVKSGEITHAVRDTKISGLKINKDDYLGIAEGKIVSAQANREDAMKFLLSDLINDESEIVTIMVGEAPDKKEVAQIRKYIEELYSHVEVEMVDGDQSIYDYLIAVE
jgi:DAK2 domain fusion protein YloV